ncbi:hypothetical protein BJ508DRAFT_108671 [Ascobolus immersus RN42]|uniref:Uncharacterized protein n=1 Tax=Ascobolus immersus RN42 TaxID=1160509 RepID=A0A3N4IJR2_ASCIM|nr:hypothetical protein BJ508DRAFT_108671 [Ascobolus immersus RN42]
MRQSECQLASLSGVCTQINGWVCAFAIRPLHRKSAPEGSKGTGSGMKPRLIHRNLDQHPACRRRWISPYDLLRSWHGDCYLLTIGNYEAPVLGWESRFGRLSTSILCGGREHLQKGHPSKDYVDSDLVSKSQSCRRYVRPPVMQNSGKTVMAN